MEEERGDGSTEGHMDRRCLSLEVILRMHLRVLSSLSSLSRLPKTVVVVVMDNGSGKGDVGISSGGVENTN